MKQYEIKVMVPVYVAVDVHDDGYGEVRSVKVNPTLVPSLDINDEVTDLDTSQVKYLWEFEEDESQTLENTWEYSIWPAWEFE